MTGSFGRRKSVLMSAYTSNHVGTSDPSGFLHAAVEGWQQPSRKGVHGFSQWFNMDLQDARKGLVSLADCVPDAKYQLRDCSARSETLTYRKSWWSIHKVSTLSHCSASAPAGASGNRELRSSDLHRRRAQWVVDQSLFGMSATIYHQGIKCWGSRGGRAMAVRMCRSRS